jgi:hypothetical protein
VSLLDASNDLGTYRVVSAVGFACRVELWAGDPQGQT